MDVDRVEADADCEAHRVDWRAKWKERYDEAGRALDELERTRGQLAESSRERDDATADERDRIVRLLAGEWGEMEVGPTESVDDLVSHIQAAAKVFMLHVTEIQGLEAKLDEARRQAQALRREFGAEETWPLPWEADSR
jgi:hypothetical protein